MNISANALVETEAMKSVVEKLLVNPSPMPHSVFVASLERQSLSRPVFREGNQFGAEGHPSDGINKLACTRVRWGNIRFDVRRETNASLCFGTRARRCRIALPLELVMPPRRFFLSLYAARLYRN